MRIRVFLLAAFSLAFAALSPCTMASAEDEPQTLELLGWVENAYLVAPNFELRAKLDTGARTSSLDARIIKRFRQWGRRWVRFVVTDPETGEETVMVRERKRTIGIVQHEGDNEVRPTVNVEICIAGMQREIEVSLVDRSNFIYPLLLGRRALKEFAIVDSGETFLANETCPDRIDRSGIVLDPSESDPDDNGEADEIEITNEGSDSEAADEDRDEDVVLEDDVRNQINP